MKKPRSSLLTFGLALFMATVLSFVRGDAFCGNKTITTSDGVCKRDIMLIIDASYSINEAAYQDFVLGFVAQIFCSYDSLILPPGARRPKFGLVIFNRQVTLAVPLNNYTRAEWQSKLTQSLGTCCSKGTPLAEAWTMAAEEFKRTREVNDNITRVAFTFTDGHPWQLLPGNPSAKWPYPNVPPEKYWFKKVPRAAQLLMDQGVNHFIHTGGIANYRKDGTSSFNDYLNGKLQSVMAPLPGQHGYGMKHYECVQHPNYPQGSDQKSCGKYFTNALGHVINSNSANYDELIGQIALETCLPPSPPSPSPVPVVAPVGTQTPTLSPLKLKLTQVDLTIFLDQSRSLHMGDEAKICGQFTPKKANIPTSKACWWLFTNFVKEFGNSLANYTENGYAFPVGWQSDYEESPSSLLSSSSSSSSSLDDDDDGDEDEEEEYEDFTEASATSFETLTSSSTEGGDYGLRVTLITFWCTNNQKVPQYRVLGANLNSQDDFERVIGRAYNTITPDGGTCPSEAIQQGVQIIGNNLMENPSRRFQAALLLTDGVFYDVPKPQQAEDGLSHFNVNRYALGIAMPLNYSQTNGRLEQERKTQRQQLTAFVNGKQENRFDLGDLGLGALPAVLDSIVKKVFDDAAGGEVKSYRPWCHFTKKTLCVHAKGCAWSSKLSRCHKIGTG